MCSVLLVGNEKNKRATKGDQLNEIYVDYGASAMVVSWQRENAKSDHIGHTSKEQQTAIRIHKTEP